MFKSLRTVSAHCDIPCKVYDPAVALVSALSVVRLIDLILEIESPSSLANTAQLSRLVAEKENQAKIVKLEVSTIWGDYFKAPQIEGHPGVHALVHQIMQTASACKQGVDRVAGEHLVKQLNEFAEMFWSSKGIATKMVVAPSPPALRVCMPALEDG